jgi:hypothetical protein
MFWVRPATPDNVHSITDEDDYQKLMWTNGVYLLSLASPDPMHRAFAVCIFVVSVSYHRVQHHDKERIALFCNVDTMIAVSIAAYMYAKGYRPWKLAPLFLVALALRTSDSSGEYASAHSSWHIISGLVLFLLGFSKKGHF